MSDAWGESLPILYGRALRPASLFMWTRLQMGGVRMCVFVRVHLGDQVKLRACGLSVK